MGLNLHDQLFERAGQALQPEICPRCQNILFSENCNYEPVEQKIVPLWRIPGTKQLYWLQTGEVLCEQKLKIREIFLVNNKWVKLKKHHATN
jgi:hypothetical protein